jgi:hypothetical protein
LSSLTNRFAAPWTGDLAESFVVGLVDHPSTTRNSLIITDLTNA